VVPAVMVGVGSEVRYPGLNLSLTTCQPESQKPPLQNVDLSMCAKCNA
jgi:hypothetical protein